MSACSPIGRVRYGGSNPSSRALLRRERRRVKATKTLEQVIKRQLSYYFNDRQTLRLNQLILQYLKQKGKDGKNLGKWKVSSGLSFKIPFDNIMIIEGDKYYCRISLHLKKHGENPSIKILEEKVTDGLK